MIMIVKGMILNHYWACDDVRSMCVGIVVLTLDTITDPVC